MRIKNLSQLKNALSEGSRFEIVNHWREEVIGQIRVVSKKQTQSIFTKVENDPNNKWSTCNGGKGSFFQFGKAKDWKFDGEMCSCFNENDELIWTIKVLEKED